jgi:cytochrome c biogenesis protein CcmG, thiol:disulfide interchange protein DsbE
VTSTLPDSPAASRDGADGSVDVMERRRPIARWIALGVGVMMVALVAVFATREPAANQVAESPLIGKLTPEITAENLDGELVRASRFRGRYLVVNFFASWCVPCRNEHPELLNFSARHARTGDAQVVAVVFNDDIEAARDWYAKNGGDWPVLKDPRGRIALDFGVGKPPETFVVDPDGLVITRIVGEVTADGLDRILARAEELRESAAGALPARPQGKGQSS